MVGAVLDLRSLDGITKTKFKQKLKQEPFRNRNEKERLEKYLQIPLNNL